MPNVAELTALIDDYESALSAARSAKPLDQAVILRVIVARETVARSLKEVKEPFGDQLQRLTSLDASLREAAKVLVQYAGKGKLPEWRDAVADDSGWWWALDGEASARGFLRAASIIVAWILVALSVSVIVEDLRRLLAGASDGISTAVQASLAFVVGGTAIQYARQLLGVAGKGENPKASAKGQYIFAVLLVTIAVALEGERANIATGFSNLGTTYKSSRPEAALGAYERATALNPDDGFAHFNLASLYERLFDYEKAENEYLAAIRHNAALPATFERLGRLNIVRRKDYANALRLFEIGLSQISNSTNVFPPEIDVNHWKYRLLVNRAWARFGLGAYAGAEEDLKNAAAIEQVSASAYCLLVQVQNKRGESDRAAREQCVDLARIDLHKTEIEPEWLSLAQEPERPAKGPGKGVGK